VTDPSGRGGDPDHKTEAQLQQSFAGAESIAELEPQYAQQILAGAKSAFVDGSNWAYMAGIVAIVLGAALVFFLYPRKDEEEKLLEQYAGEDTEPSAREAP
jgi:MFS transporter, DHA2 family, multidrug resistance protein